MIFPYDLSYRPQSQSVVIIKNFINIREGKMKKNYNIDFSLSFIIKIKNRTYSRILGTTPNELFFKVFNEEEINCIIIKC